MNKNRGRKKTYNPKKALITRAAAGIHKIQIYNGDCLKRMMYVDVASDPFVRQMQGKLLETGCYRWHVWIGVFWIDSEGARHVTEITHASHEPVALKPLQESLTEELTQTVAAKEAIGATVVSKGYFSTPMPVDLVAMSDELQAFFIERHAFDVAFCEKMIDKKALVEKLASMVAQ